MRLTVITGTVIYHDNMSDWLALMGLPFISCFKVPLITAAQSINTDTAHTQGPTPYCVFSPALPTPDGRSRVLMINFKNLYTNNSLLPL